jgi:hypothetical protein
MLRAGQARAQHYSFRIRESIVKCFAQFGHSIAVCLQRHPPNTSISRFFSSQQEWTMACFILPEFG